MPEEKKEVTTVEKWLAICCMDLIGERDMWRTIAITSLSVDAAVIIGAFFYFMGVFS